MSGPFENGSATASADARPRRFQAGRTLAYLLAAASVGLAAWVIIHHLTRDRGPGFDRMTHWICLSRETCGKPFSMTLGEYMRRVEEGPPGGPPRELTLAELAAQSQCGNSPDAPLWCPHCGSYLVARAWPCPHCGAEVRLGAHGMMPSVCAECGKNPGAPTLEPLFENEPASDP